MRRYVLALTFVLVVFSSEFSVFSFQRTEGPLMVGSRLETIGNSAVIVIDARHASVAPAAAGAVTAGTGVAFHVLRSGMTLDLARP
jgi:hypothetical protein